MAAPRYTAAPPVRRIAGWLPGAVLLVGACTNDYSALDVSGGPSSEAGGSTGAGGGTGAGGSAAGGGASAGGAGGGSGGGAGGGPAAGGAAGPDGGAGGTVPAEGGPDAAVSSGGAGPGDGGSGGSTPEAGPEAGPPSCTDLYGAAAGFTLCAETDTSCRMGVATAGSNCDTLCQSFGGSCLAAADNVNDQEPCTPRPTVDTCATNRAATICTCSRP